MSASHDSARHHALNEIQNHPHGHPRQGHPRQGNGRGRHARRPQSGVNRLLGVNDGSTGRRLKAGLTTLAATGALLGGTAVAAPSADASALTIGQKALRIAESKHGDPYRWGATGPNAFDCSGLTYYAFKRAGHRLPRTAEDQYNHVRHISFSQLRPGDLVFFHYGSYVYHVGIYAGHWEIWHAPHSGSYVKLEHIWTDSVWFGRVS